MVGIGGYEAHGNITKLGAVTMGYDAESNMTSTVDRGTGQSASWIYDAEGQRAEQIIAGGASTIYVHDAFGNLAAEYNNLGVAPACTTCYLTYDMLGTVRMVTDQNQALVARHDFIPFGEEIISAAANRDPINKFGASGNVMQQFTGQEADGTVASLHYFNARHLAGVLGGFVQPDPENAGGDILNPQSWNGYGYVMGNPMGFTDPSGMFAEANPNPPPGWGPPEDIYQSIAQAGYSFFLAFNGPIPTTGNSSGGGASGGNNAVHINKFAPVPAKNVFTIEANRGTLVLNKVLPKVCMISGTYRYSTGMNGNTDYKMAGQGPLPPGNYTLHPYEISPAGFFRKYIDFRDWGDFRVSLHPDAGTNTYGRSGFFLHGGTLRHGSEGCLKVESSNQNDLFQQLQGAADPVPVKVTVP